MKTKIGNIKMLKQKDLIIFDLDGTLIETKSPMKARMSKLLIELLKRKKVAVIGGGKYEVFQELFVRKFRCPEGLLKKLFLFPTTATAFYRYNRGWKNIYSLALTSTDTTRIKKAFEEVFQEIGYRHPQKTYGEIIENRKTQVSFSVFGQDLVRVLGAKGVAMKKKWLRENLKTKMKIANLVAKKLPGLEVRAAGFTTIDVTKKDIDKAYGIRQIKKYLKIPTNKMLFVGDAIFKGGNDYAVVKTGVDYIAIKGPKEVEKIIHQMVTN